jgi:hypothetical protein
VTLHSLSDTEVRLARDEVRDRRVIAELTAALTPEMGGDAEEGARILRAAIARASAATADVRSARAEALLHVARSLVGLREALAAREWERLRECIAEIRAEGCPPAIAEELEAAQAALDDHAVVVALSAALGGGSATGSVGAYDTSAVDVATLQAAVSLANEKGCRSAHAARLLMTARLISRLRGGVLAGEWAGEVGDLLEESFARTLTMRESDEDARARQDAEADAVATAAATSIAAVSIVGAAASAAVTKKAAALWTEHTDPGSGRKFFFNIETRHSSWAADDASGRRASTVGFGGRRASAIALEGAGSAAPPPPPAGTPGTPGTPRRVSVMVRGGGGSGSGSVPGGKYKKGQRRASVSGGLSYIDEGAEGADPDGGELPLGGAELLLAAAERKDRSMVAAFVAALSAGGARGEPGRLHVEHIDTNALKVAVESARQQGCASARSARLLKMAGVVLQLREALKAGRWEDAELPLATAVALQKEALGSTATSGGPAAAAVKPVRASRLRSASGGGGLTGRARAASASAEAQRKEQAEAAVAAAAAAEEAKRHPATAAADLGCVAEELKLAREDAHVRAVWRKVTDALANGMAGGTVGAINLSTLQTDILEMAISEAALMAVKTPASDALIKSARVVLKVRLALRARNWERAAAALPRTEADLAALLPLVHDELRMVRHEVDNTSMLQQLGAALGAGAATPLDHVNEPGCDGRPAELLDVHSCKVEALAAAIAFSAPLARTERAQALLRSARVVVALRKAQLDSDWARVMAVLDGTGGGGGGGDDDDDDVDAAILNGQVAAAAAAAAAAAGGAGVVDECLDEMRRAREHAADKTLRSVLTNALRTGAARGRVGVIDLSQVSYEALEDAITEAEESLGQGGCRTAAAARLLETAEKMESLRTALVEDDWGEIQALLEEIDGTAAESEGAPGAMEAAAAADAASAALAGDGAPILLDDIVLEELSLIRAEAHDRKTLAGLTAALQRGGAVHVTRLGEIAEEGDERLETHELEHALTRARAVSSRRQSKAVTDMLQHVEHVHALRVAQRSGDVAAAHELAHKHDLDALPEESRAEVLRARFEANDKILRDRLQHAMGAGGVALLPADAMGAREEREAEEYAAAQATAAQEAAAAGAGAAAAVVSMRWTAGTLAMALDLRALETGGLTDAIARTEEQLATDRSAVSARTMVHLRSAQLVLQARTAARQDWGRVHELLRTVPPGGVAPPALAEIELVRAAAADVRASSVLRAALAVGSARADGGWLDPASVSTAQLDAAIAEAAKLAAQNARHLEAAGADGAAGAAAAAMAAATAVAEGRTTAEMTAAAAEAAAAAAATYGGGRKLLRGARLVRKLRAAQRAGEYERVERVAMDAGFGGLLAEIRYGEGGAAHTPAPGIDAAAAARGDGSAALPLEARAEVLATLRDVEHRRTLERLSAALNMGRAAGPGVGQYDLLTISVTALEEVIDECSRRQTPLAPEEEEEELPRVAAAASRGDGGGPPPRPVAEVFMGGSTPVAAAAAAAAAGGVAPKVDVGLADGLLQVARLVVRLRLAWKGRDWPSLGAALASLKSLKYHAALPRVVEEMRAARRELFDVRATAKLGSALSHGALSGIPGAVVMSTIEVGPLEEAVALASDAERIEGVQIASMKRRVTRRKASLLAAASAAKAESPAARFAAAFGVDPAAAAGLAADLCARVVVSGGGGGSGSGSYDVGAQLPFIVSPQALAAAAALSGDRFAALASLGFDGAAAQAALDAGATFALRVFDASAARAATWDDVLEAAAARFPALRAHLEAAHEALRSTPLAKIEAAIPLLDEEGDGDESGSSGGGGGITLRALAAAGEADPRFVTSLRLAQGEGEAPDGDATQVLWQVRALLYNEMGLLGGFGGADLFGGDSSSAAEEGDEEEEEDGYLVAPPSAVAGGESIDLFGASSSASALASAPAAAVVAPSDEDGAEKAEDGAEKAAPSDEDAPRHRSRRCANLLSAARAVCALRTALEDRDWTGESSGGGGGVRRALEVLELLQLKIGPSESSAPPQAESSPRKGSSSQSARTRAISSATSASTASAAVEAHAAIWAAIAAESSLARAEMDSAVLCDALRAAIGAGRTAWSADGHLDTLGIDVAGLDRAIGAARARQRALALAAREAAKAAPGPSKATARKGSKAAAAAAAAADGAGGGAAPTAGAAVGLLPQHQRLSGQATTLLRAAKLLRGLRGAVAAEEWSVVRRLLASWAEEYAAATSGPGAAPLSAEDLAGAAAVLPPPGSAAERRWPGLAAVALDEVECVSSAARADLVYAELVKALGRGAIKVAPEHADLVDASAIDAEALEAAIGVASRHAYVGGATTVLVLFRSSFC